MYTIEHNINSLQELVEHMYKLSQIEVSIGSDSFVTISTKVSEQFNDFYCLKDKQISNHCYEFWNSATIAGLKKKEFNDRCWAGVRLTTKMVTVNNQLYFIMLDRFILDTDEKYIDTPEIRKVGATKGDVEEIYSKIPITTQERISELFALIEQGLVELNDRGIPLLETLDII